MVDLSTWRARIGQFGFKVKCRSSQVCLNYNTAGDTERWALSDLLLATVLCLLFGTMCYSVVENVKTVYCEHSSRVSLIQMEHLQQGTYLFTDTVGHSSSNSAHYQLLLHIVVSVCVMTNLWLSLKKILLSGDVELNPGPDSRKGELEKTDIILSNKIDQVLNAFEVQNQKMEEHAARANGEFRDIKQTLVTVDEKCEDIKKRCDRLEEENHLLTNKVLELTDELRAVSTEMATARQERKQFSETVKLMQNQMNEMDEEIDRLESFSRRDNLRFFGIPESDREDYTQCANAVIDALNEADGDTTWTTDDVIRAHRVGRARNGNPRVMISKFRNWNDKMFVIRDKSFRSRLENIGIRVANDLTRRQAVMVARAKREGQAAYFVRGKMVVGPRRADPRTYAEVTAGRETTTTRGLRGMDTVAVQSVRDSSLTAAATTEAAPTTSGSGDTAGVRDDEGFPDQGTGDHRGDVLCRQEDSARDRGQPASRQHTHGRQTGSTTQRVVNGGGNRGGGVGPRNATGGGGNGRGGGNTRQARETVTERRESRGGKSQGNMRTFLSGGGGVNTASDSQRRLRSDSSQK